MSAPIMQPTNAFEESFRQFLTEPETQAAIRGDQEKEINMMQKADEFERLEELQGQREQLAVAGDVRVDAKQVADGLGAAAVQSDENLVENHGNLLHLTAVTDEGPLPERVEELHAAGALADGLDEQRAQRLVGSQRHVDRVPIKDLQGLRVPPQQHLLAVIEEGRGGLP